MLRKSATKANVPSKKSLMSAGVCATRRPRMAAMSLVQSSSRTTSRNSESVAWYGVAGARRS